MAHNNSGIALAFAPQNLSQWTGHAFSGTVMLLYLPAVA
jgi:hypothetical protein